MNKINGVWHFTELICTDEDVKNVLSLLEKNPILGNMDISYGDKIIKIRTKFLD